MLKEENRRITKPIQYRWQTRKICRIRADKTIGNLIRSEIERKIRIELMEDEKIYVG